MPLVHDVGHTLILALAAANPVDRSAPLYLFGGMAGLMAASLLLSHIVPRLAGNARGRGNGDREPVGLRALGYFFPIAGASLVALLMGQPNVALAVVFGSSVGALTSVVGLTALAEPIGSGPREWMRVWPFVLAASLIVFIAGFKGTFQWQDAVALLTQGAVIFGLIFDPRDKPRTHLGNEHFELVDVPAQDSESAPLVYASARPAASSNLTWERTALAAVELLLVAGMLWVGAVAATRGVVRTGAARSMNPSALAASLIGLALVLPMTWGAWRRAEGGRSWSPVSTQVSVVLLNLCVLLPLLILMPYAAAKLPFLSRFAGDALAYHEGMPRVLLYPTPMWRIDNVVLIIVAVLLLPVSLGRWNLGREEGMVLIAGYFFYLTATLLTG
jgi:Ca2+/Na+ antiporter